MKLDLEFMLRWKVKYKPVVQWVKKREREFSLLFRFREFAVVHLFTYSFEWEMLWLADTGITFHASSCINLRVSLAFSFLDVKYSLSTIDLTIEWMTEKVNCPLVLEFDFTSNCFSPTEIHSLAHRLACDWFCFVVLKRKFYFPRRKKHLSKCRTI